MELKQHVEPTRDDILDQLRKRELYVPNAECLAMEQLLHIYNSFIIPHPQRERRERRRTQTETQPKPANRCAPEEFEQLMKRSNGPVVCVASEKRPIELATGSPGHLLNCPRKRIKIELKQ
ncbi:hypothetical protein AWZ03_012855 [Drosophila navojoa]|uniref:Uncharacterized protein n=1 Tax=Drosophila navojoa TaxID=7232 RepID=A0A484AYN4_DRONA|nr:uncharacterized protein LOC108655455 [Drosophila navojoa]TDG40721.1 hypothetical protein AWZ03_012855 [Drosophila navojoa]